MAAPMLELLDHAQGRGAVFSEDGIYRLALWRSVQLYLNAPAGAANRPLVFVMLNPSKAGATEDDPTVRKCLGLAKRWHYGRLVVVNLFAYVATHPVDLWKAQDPIGEGCDAWIQLAAALAVRDGGRVVAAWGRNAAGKRRVVEVLKLLEGLDLWALDLTLDGIPKHPARLPYSLEPMVWKPKTREFDPRAPLGGA